MAGPLAGLKILDLGWIMAGPLAARYLTDNGAETIKVESSQRRDPLRSLGPHKDGKPGNNRSIAYHWINAGKRSIDIDIKSARGLELVKRLAAQADILLESFTPGAIDKMGLGYEVLSSVNPRLIMVSSGILGRKGTMGMGTSGQGQTGAAFSGATYLMGWPDSPPSGPAGPWTDACAPRYAALAILAAVHRREETGQGCHIDISQAEAGLQFLQPAFMEFAANGKVPERRGTATSKWRAPCSAYRCKGPDPWVVIDAPGDLEWQALRTIIGGSLLDQRYSTLVGRLRNADGLNRAIENWTSDKLNHDIETSLQAAGVPAHVISTDADLAHDPDLEASDYLSRVADPVIGEIWLAGSQFTLEPSSRPGLRPGPGIGASTDAILAGELGLTPHEIAVLRQDRIIG